MKTHQYIKYFLVILFSSYFILAKSAVIGTPELDKAMRPASLPSTYPFVMVFKNNKLNYIHGIFKSYADSKNKVVTAKMISNWTENHSILKYRISLDDLKLLWSRVKKELESLANAKQEYKIIYVGVWYEALSQQEKFIKQRNEYLKLFKDYEKQHDNVKILNIDFDLNF